MTIAYLDGISWEFANIATAALRVWFLKLNLLVSTSVYIALIPIFT
jgi:hypothetical protein